MRLRLGTAGDVRPGVGVQGWACGAQGQAGSSGPGGFHPRWKSQATTASGSEGRGTTAFLVLSFLRESFGFGAWCPSPYKSKIGVDSLRVYYLGMLRP